MNHTDKLILLPVERYEMLLRMSQPPAPSSVADPPKEMIVNSLDENSERVDGEGPQSAATASAVTATPATRAEGESAGRSMGKDRPEILPESIKKEHLSARDIINSMNREDRQYASKILSHMDPSLWDSDGSLINLELTVQDLIKYLKNLTNGGGGKPITKTVQKNIRHFIYKHTSIKPNALFNSKYARKGPERKPQSSAKTSKIQWQNQ